MTEPLDLMAHVEALEHEITRLRKVNAVLMTRVERSLDNTGDSYSLFESNILLQKTIDDRTRDLKAEVVERQRIETELRESRQRLLLHVQQTPLGVIEWDLDFRVVQWNAAAERLFGYTREEAVGRHAIGLIIREDQRDAVAAIFVRLLNKSGGLRGTNENIRKDGSVLICEWYNTPLVDEFGKVVGIASLVQDITERVNNDREKRERLERVQKQRIAIGRMTTESSITGGDFEQAATIILEIVAEALSVTRVGLWRLNPQGDQLECLDLYQTSDDLHCRGAMLQQNDYPEYFEAVNHERVLVCDDARRDPRTRRFSETHLVPLGITSLLDIAFRVSGDLIGVVCIGHTGEVRTWRADEIAFADEISSILSQVYLNSERRRAEAQKRELQDRLERAQRMESLGILAGGVAHDLNNMLGPVVGYAELILTQTDPNDKIAARVQKIAKSARDAADVIQDLLTLARRGRYEMSPTDLNQVVTDYLESPAFIKLSETRPEVSIQLKLDDSIGRLMGSSAHLSKVVMNLVVNAYDAMPKGGTLTLTTSSGRVDSLSSGYDIGDASGDYLTFSVADTGNGIPAEDLAKIFEPYYSKKKMGCTSGSGLGLSVVYGIVKDHKAFYDIVTAPGQGTDFRIFFPITSERLVLEDTGSQRQGGSESILVVDDNQDQRDVAAELLRSLGYSVQVAASGEAAVEYLQTNSVDVLLLDMIMDPGMDGLDTYREIIRVHPGQKAIVASGFSATERVLELLRLGTGRYIRKPYTLATLAKTLRQELSQAEQPVG